MTSRQGRLENLLGGFGSFHRLGLLENLGDCSHCGSGNLSFLWGLAQVLLHNLRPESGLLD